MRCITRQRLQHALSVSFLRVPALVDVRFGKLLLLAYLAFDGIHIYRVVGDDSIPSRRLPVLGSVDAVAVGLDNHCGENAGTGTGGDYGPYKRRLDGVAKPRT